MTKIKITKKKIKQSYDKKQDCLEKKLKVGATKSRLLRKIKDKYDKKSKKN